MPSHGFKFGFRPSVADGRRQAVSKSALALPPTLAPRGLQREAAAGYIGVGLTKFDEMVKDGRMPEPKRVDGRKIWDRLALDIAFEALPDDNQPANDWDERLKSA